MSATNVARAGKRGNICVGNNVSATVCPRLPGLLLCPCVFFESFRRDLNEAKAVYVACNVVNY